jgi:hypothetical protein
MTINYPNSTLKVRKTTLDHLKSQKMQGETYDHLFNRILDDWELEQKNCSDIEKANQLAKEAIDSCKNELDDLFD